ncbi:MAG: hypothetical protein RQ745_13205 [Longimicrobiales bacterium]|nr:hypothetical protein [Longimicrobiales bacterium]
MHGPSPTPDHAPDESPPDPHASGDGDDTTLGGYFRVHDRPPAFEGPDGHPYTVSIEVEKTADLRAPWEGFLVFPRWARTGLGVVGHLESGTLWRGRTRDEVLQKAGEASLHEVKGWLDTVIERREQPTEGAE